MDAHSSEPIPRAAARVLVIDERGRILLFRFVSPETGREYWITPGGGLDEGETHEEAALRELREETGIADALLGPCVWVREHLIPWRGQRFAQRERFYVARVTRTDVDVSGLDEVEAPVLVEHRWWSVEDIAASGETFSPRRLAELLPPILRAELPDRPVEIGR